MTLSAFRSIHRSSPSTSRIQLQVPGTPDLSFRCDLDRKVHFIVLSSPCPSWTPRSSAMLFSGLQMSTLQASPRRIIFPMLHENSEAARGTSLVASSLLNSPASYPQHVRREQHSCGGILVKSSSIESDMPSLASLSSSSEQGSMSVETDCDVSLSERRAGFNKGPCQWNSKKKRGESKLVRFDPRIWVHEFKRSRTEVEALWFTAKEMCNFKSVAIQCIIAYNFCKNQRGSGKVLYSHPALGVDGQYDPTLAYQNRDIATSFAPVSQLRVNQFRDAVAETEVRNILVVNSHDAFLNLFAKGMRKIFPYAMIVSASTREDTLTHIEERLSKQKAETNKFDIIIVDENLTKKCCSELHDASSTRAPFLLDITDAYGSHDMPMKTLFVGVCSDFKTGNMKLKAHGADLVWQKPPPLMDEHLRDTILRALLTKRGRISIAKKLF
jgi:vacuolar-type H+-ATPase subunit F/Vma7